MSAIGFAFKPSVALLSIDDMQLTWLPKIEKEHAIFKQLSKVKEFEFYFINDILVIPDPIPVARENWNRKIGINDLEIECMGSWLVFLSFKELKEEFFFAESLTLPQYEFLKNRIRWV
ncbi:hypothetical protein [Lysinibacillus sphaericus]|uniref:hypothetical protein n=1 Tax=Lysinibacillus sphaericus TaxID=1421 RepID=UPI001A9CE79A|nr:hypothetical protein [Lysinibacillus sphaericus]QTB26594.1 hypothetical protein J2D51_20665 [Lysinibacillus sphaericus]